MQGPDERLFEDDLSSAGFRMGVANRQWGLPDQDVLPQQPVWPARILWIAAAPREGAPDRFYILIDAAGYRSVPPTGTFWDPNTKSRLDLSKRPKGKNGSKVAMVFRIDWPPHDKGSAFYHPYDRVAVQDHSQWPAQLPNLVWDSNRTIVDYLSEFYTLLSSENYLGV